MKITKTLAIVVLGSALILATGCKATKDIGDKLIDDSKKTYDDAAKKVNDVKDATVQKVNDIQDAAKKIKDATDAVQKVTGDSKTTPPPTK
jgi:peptidoglycan hydrolase CwlO-like protein